MKLNFKSVPPEMAVIALNLLANSARFKTNRGLCDLESVVQMPLKSRDDFDLDSVAININEEIKSHETGSFVSSAPSPRLTELKNQLEFVKYIIAHKIDANKKAADRAARLSELNKIREVLAGKKEESIQALSVEQLETRARELEQAED
jgi:hypothetical protein